MGLTGHGKTRFVDGLITALDEVGRYWPGCAPEWLDDRRIREIMAELRDYRGGQERQATRMTLPEPQVIRLHDVPRVGDSQLILFDHSGEIFQSARDTMDYGARMGRASAIIWLASLLEKPDARAAAFAEVPAREFTAALNVYLTALDQMGTDPKRQRVVFTLTKSERLIQRWPTFPASARAILDSPTGGDPLLAPGAEPFAILGESSKDLRGWLIGLGYHDLVHLLERYFGSVFYTAVSAQWGEATEPAGETTVFSPRAVLAPLFWVWRRGPGAWLIPPGTSARTFYPSIHAAVAAASPGAVIELEPGTHDLPAALNIKIPLTLTSVERSDGDREPPRLRRGGGKYTLGIQVGDTEQVIVRDIALEDAADRPGDGVIVTAGRLLLERVAVSGATRPGGSTKQPFGAAVVLAGTAEVDARACTFVGNTVGIQVRNERDCRVSDCLFENNGIGLQAVKVYRLILERNVFRANTLSGLELLGESKCRSSSDQFESHPERGVYVTDSARIVATDLAADGINRGRYGVLVSDGAQADLIRGRLRGHTSAGGLARGDARLGLQQVEIHDNPAVGLKYEGESGGLFADCRLTDNATAGLQLSDRATPTAGAGNTFLGNEDADIVIDGTVPPEVDLTAAVGPGVRVVDHRRGGGGGAPKGGWFRRGR